VTEGRNLKDGTIQIKGRKQGMKDGRKVKEGRTVMEEGMKVKEGRKI
jgi:hypothetical protein